MQFVVLEHSMDIGAKIPEPPGPARPKGRDDHDRPASSVVSANVALRDEAV
jgi:hypothetical protein